MADETTAPNSLAGSTTGPAKDSGSAGPAKASGTARTAKARGAAAGARPRAATRASASRAKASAGASTRKAPRGRSTGSGGSRRGPSPRTNSTRAGSRGTVDLVGDYAERVVLIPVGAVLLARERVVSNVADVISIYSTPAKTQTQLRKFERRGSTARTRLEREVRKTRTRVERELRLRRRELDKRREHLTKSVSSQVEQTQAQIEKTQSQIEEALRTRLEDGVDFAGRIQERVLNLV
jgi:hypothetical protein